jgi:putative selenate reductase
MGEFRPYPFAALVRRLLREIPLRQAAFDLPAKKFARGSPGHDLSVRVHGEMAGSPLGPAAGPHTQLAQNIVLSWLAGGRVIELKTVQARDDLTIPRPCIDMRTVGLNVEWSQELGIYASLEEYVKASMLLDILRESGLVPLAPGFERTVFEASVGYDLAGIRGAKVQGFLRGLADARPIVDRLRRQIPDEHRRYRDLDFRTRLVSGVTLSTFHGCPPGEIAEIAELLLRQNQLSCVIKHNPTLLGKEALLALLHGRLGHRELVVPERAFAHDLGWEQALALFERLDGTARELGLSHGIKLTNTLVVENRGGFLPASEPEAYLSGPPLHVLAMELVRRFRGALGARVPISFSAGIDAHNFADAVALDLRPVTVCTDWLKAGGYGRAAHYFEELGRRMSAVRASSREDFVLRAFGQAAPALAAMEVDPETRARCEQALAEGSSLRAAAGEALHTRWLDEAALRNTAVYVDALAGDARYGAEGAARAPKKIGRALQRFDCLSCNKCIPACPNDAVFTLDLPLREEQQIAIFADACNACGNCDVICPEDGGPYRSKPRFFGSREAFAASEGDAFFLERNEDEGSERLLARVEGEALRLEIQGDLVLYAGPGFELSLREGDPEGTARGTGIERADLARFRWLNGLRRAVFHSNSVNFINCLS